MKFEWDDRKNASNLRKHGVDFSVGRAFDWDGARYDDEMDHEGEDRHVAYGFASDGFGYVIAFTFRGEAIRIISARRFTRSDYRRFSAGPLR